MKKKGCNFLVTKPFVSEGQSMPLFPEQEPSSQSPKTVPKPRVQDLLVVGSSPQETGANGQCEDGPQPPISQSLMNANVVTAHSEAPVDNSFFRFLGNPKNKLTIESSGFLNNIFNLNPLTANKSGPRPPENAPSASGRENNGCFEANFEVKDSLGRGEHGRVLKVLDRRDLQFYAVKELLGRKEEHQNEIVKMSRIHSLVSSSNIVKYNYSFYEQGRWYIVMEYCKMNLRQKFRTLRRNQQRMRHADLLRLIKHISKGLHKLHKNGVAHLDLKPENILVSHVKGKLKYKIGDMGHAQFTCFFHAGSRALGQRGTSDLRNGSWVSPDKASLNQVIEETYEDGEICMLKENKSQELDNLELLQSKYLNEPPRHMNELFKVKTPDLAQKVFTPLTDKHWQSLLRNRSCVLGSRDAPSAKSPQIRPTQQGVLLPNHGLQILSNRNSSSIVSEKPKIKSVSHTVGANSSRKTLKSAKTPREQPPRSRWVTPSQHLGSRMSLHSDNLTQAQLDNQIRNCRQTLKFGDSRYAAKELFRNFGKNLNRRPAGQAKRRKLSECQANSRVASSMKQSRRGRLEMNFSGDGLGGGGGGGRALALTPDLMQPRRDPSRDKAQGLILNHGVLTNHLADNFMNESQSVIRDSFVSEQSLELSLVHKADIFSFGLIVMEVVNIAKDFQLPPNGCLWRSLREEPSFFINLLDCPPEIKTLLGHMLQKNPEKRISAKRILDFVQRLKKASKIRHKKSQSDLPSISEFDLESGNARRGPSRPGPDANLQSLDSVPWGRFGQNDLFDQRKQSKSIDQGARHEKGQKQRDSMNVFNNSLNSILNSISSIHEPKLESQRRRQDAAQESGTRLQSNLKSSSSYERLRLSGDRPREGPDLFRAVDLNPNVIFKKMNPIFLRRPLNVDGLGEDKVTSESAKTRVDPSNSNSTVPGIGTSNASRRDEPVVAGDMKRQANVINPNTISFKDMGDQLRVAQGREPPAQSRRKNVKFQNNAIFLEEAPARRKGPQSFVSVAQFRKEMKSKIFNSNIISFQNFFSEENRSIANKFQSQNMQKKQFKLKKFQSSERTIQSNKKTPSKKSKFLMKIKKKLQVRSQQNSQAKARVVASLAGDLCTRKKQKLSSSWLKSKTVSSASKRPSEQPKCFAVCKRGLGGGPKRDPRPKQHNFTFNENDFEDAIQLFSKDRFTVKKLKGRDARKGVPDRDRRGPKAKWCSSKEMSLNLTQSAVQSGGRSVGSGSGPGKDARPSRKKESLAFIYQRKKRGNSLKRKTANN